MTANVRKFAVILLCILLDSSDGHKTQLDDVHNHDAHNRILPNLRWEVIGELPHDRSSFTQGLTYHDGVLFEGTGLYGKSRLRRINPINGLVQKSSLYMQYKYFGEGITHYIDQNGLDRIIQITWKNKVGFIYTLGFSQLSSFSFQTTTNQGWGITHDGNGSFIVSDGSAYLHFWDDVTLLEYKKVLVTHNGQNIDLLNELEYVNGRILANRWYTDDIFNIDPINGRVFQVYNFSSLPRTGNVMNGISRTGTSGELFVTGKWWPKIYRIKLLDFWDESTEPSHLPSNSHSFNPSNMKSLKPSILNIAPSNSPSKAQTYIPSSLPSSSRTSSPSDSFIPTLNPSRDLSMAPSDESSLKPSQYPSIKKIIEPSSNPTYSPSSELSHKPSSYMTMLPRFIQQARAIASCPTGYYPIVDTNKCVQASKYLGLVSDPAKNGNDYPANDVVCFVSFVKKNGKTSHKSTTRVNSNHFSLAAWICELEIVTGTIEPTSRELGLCIQKVTNRNTRQGENIRKHHRTDMRTCNNRIPKTNREGCRTATKKAFGKNLAALARKMKKSVRICRGRHARHF